MTITGMHTIKAYKKIIICYFPGTGNSKNVACWFSQVANENGIGCQINNIAKIDTHSVKQIMQPFFNLYALVNFIVGSALTIAFLCIWYRLIH